MGEKPVYDAFKRFLADPGTPFGTPGHKYNPELINDFLALDVPHYLGVENRRVSTRRLATAERLAGELWGADWYGFSVQGSSHGRAPDSEAVMLVEPSYVGGASDVAAHAKLAHAHGIPLAVDAAWGAHPGFHPESASRHSGRRRHPGDQHPQDGHRIHPVFHGAGPRRTH